MTAPAAPLMSTLCRNSRHAACTARASCHCICHRGGRMSHPADARRLAHRNDPAGSHVAAEHMVKSGKADSHREVILADLRQHPGSTAGEIADRIDDPAIDDVEVRRRLTDAKRRGEAWQGYTRICAVAHTNQQEWWTAEDAKQGSLPI